MKSAMKKTTFREIKGSFSRWIAILAICMLGVGFFCGIKVCKEAFILTGNTFLSDNCFYDYELISTLGLEDKDVEKFQALEGIANARGSYSTDALFTLSGGEAVSDETEDAAGQRVAKFHALIDDMNTPEIKSGRLPQAPNECVGDSRYFSESDIGSEIVISNSNESDTRDLFAYDTYEIVGLCESPLYLNFERGSTSLGNGSVATYLYIPLEGWDSEIYTEIYVTLENQGVIYSDEYKQNAEAMKKPLEDALETCANSRYDEILGEANEKLADARAELEDAKSELKKAEKKIADGKKQISDGEKELDANEKKLADSAAELKKARKEYEASLSEFNTQKENAYAELAAQKEQIEAAAGTPYYEQYLAQYNAAKEAADAKFEAAAAELKAAEAKITSGEKEVKSGYTKLEDGRKELEKSKKELADGQKELADGKKQVADGQKELRKAEDKVEDIENPKTYVLGRDTNIGYVCFDNDTSIVNSIAKVFPVFFFLVAALVCMTTMTRMIDEQRTQIGVLKALGYSRARILGKYMFYAASASLIGGLLGFFGGSFLFPGVIWTA